MVSVKKSDTGKQGSQLSAVKILSDALYIATALFVLGFLGQSIANLLLAG